MGNEAFRSSIESGNDFFRAKKVAPVDLRGALEEAKTRIINSTPSTYLPTPKSVDEAHTTPASVVDVFGG